MGDPQHAAASKAVTTASSSASDVTRPPGPHLVPAEVRPLDPGTVLNSRYEIISLLGFGGMGAVYRAFDRELERDVALKTIRNDLANDRAILQRFKHELVLARQITHRNVIRIFDIGEAEGLKYITMEYVDGQDLANVLRTRTKLPPNEAADIIAQVCDGLAAAHAEGVIHRDLKPSNVMVGANGRVYVMDFGLARTCGDLGLTQTGALLGTFEYMSPEQARGEKLDARSDLYTVGLIFYELLTGEPAFKADSAVASLWKRIQTRPDPVSKIDPKIPRPLSNIVERCLEGDRDKRYQSAGEILGDLTRWDAKALSHTFAPYPVVASPSRVILGQRMSPLMWIALAVFIAVIAVAAYFGFRNNEKTEQAHAAVSLLVADFDNRTNDDVFNGTLEPTMTLALEGAPFISSYSRQDAHRIAAQIQPGATRLDEALARLVAVRQGLSVIISGSIERAGNGMKVTVRALDATNGNVMLERSADVSSKDAVLHKLSDLAIAVRKTLGDTTPESVQAAAAETFTSGSLEAAHEYAVAQDLQHSGNWQGAVQHYSAALKLDPNMGRALAGMAIATANLGQRSAAENYYKLALAHLDRMTEREKLRTRGGYYLFMREPQKAIEEFGTLAKEFPADAVAYGNLSLAYFYTHDMQRALKGGIDALALTPKVLAQRNNVALYAAYAGDYPAAEKYANEVIAANPAYAEAYGALAMAQIGEGKITAAQETYGKLNALGARGASAAVTGLADIAAYEGRYADSVTLLDQGFAADVAAKDNNAAALKSLALGEAYLGLNDKARAADAAERALTLDKQVSTVYGAGAILAQAGQSAKAATLAEDLERRVEPEPQMYAKLLRGEIALRGSNGLQAIQAFQQAQQVTNSWLGHFGLGRAYLLVDKFAEANSEFETCLKRRGETSAVFLDDVPTLRYLPPVYYYLARTQEGLNSADSAASYRTFLTMRKSADALAVDAQRRIAAH